MSTGSDVEPSAAAAVGRVEWALVAAALVVGAVLRLAWVEQRELWYDDLDRLRLSLYSTECLVERLPYINPLKSPYLVLLHKAWTGVVGHGSVLAIRGFGVLAGLGIVALVHPVVRRCAGPAAAVAAVWYYALDPFFVRWSIEVHSYAPAGLAALGAWWLALTTRTPTRTRLILLGSLGGLAAALFPPVALALAPLVLVPAIRSCRDRWAWAGAALAAATIALPAALSIAASWRVHGPAYAAGRAWSPDFTLGQTPFELLTRLAGLQVARGAFAWWMGAGAALVATGTAISLSIRRATDAPADWWLRVAVLAAGVLPFVGLVVLSQTGIGVFTDRYVHGAAILLPAGVVAALGWRTGVARIVTVVIVAALAVPLLLGAPRTLQGPGFPRGSAGLRYSCNELLDAVAAESAPPALILVHGEAVYSQLWLRSDVLHRLDGESYHLTTRAWRQVQRERDTAQVSIPRAYGWTFALEELVGPGVSLDPAEAAERIRRTSAFWVVIERQRMIRQRHLEEEESEGGFDDAFDAVGESPDRDGRDERIAAGVLSHLGLDPAEWVVRVRSRGRAVVAMAHRR